MVRKGDTPNLLTCDQAVFLKRFRQDVSTRPEQGALLARLQATFVQWAEADGAFLKKSLLPSVTSAACSTARAAHQDSLVRLLLNTPDTQPLLLAWLLEQLALVSLEEEQLAEAAHSQVPRLILTAARFLNHIEQGEGLQQKLVDIMVACSEHVLVEVVTALPEILPDGQHDAMAGELATMLEEGRGATATILDTLANLYLSRGVTAQVRGVVVGRLGRWGQADLPAVVEFLLTSVTKEDAAALVAELRWEGGRRTVQPLLQGEPAADAAAGGEPAAQAGQRDQEVGGQGEVGGEAPCGAVHSLHSLHQVRGDARAGQAQDGGQQVSLASPIAALPTC